MTTELGRAPIVQRNTPTFPTRRAAYFDCTAWGGGFIRITGGPGAVVLSGDVLLNLSNGHVYRDPRFTSVMTEGE